VQVQTLSVSRVNFIGLPFKLRVGVVQEQGLDSRTGVVLCCPFFGLEPSPFVVILRKTKVS
jgi:hypothetical protein